MWSLYPGNVHGIKVEGDKATLATKWWNLRFLIRWGWQTVTVFEVSEEDARRGYQIGFLPFDGQAKLESVINHDRRFRMKNGHEDCTFFIITSDGKEAPLKVIARTTKNDAAYEHVPLH